MKFARFEGKFDISRRFSIMGRKNVVVPKVEKK